MFKPARDSRFGAPDPWKAGVKCHQCFWSESVHRVAQTPLASIQRIAIKHSENLYWGMRRQLQWRLGTLRRRLCPTLIGHYSGRVDFPVSPGEWAYRAGWFSNAAF